MPFTDLKLAYRGQKLDPEPIRISRRRPDARGWPSYQPCAENTPPPRGGADPTVSPADFTFCRLTIGDGAARRRACLQDSR